jgi:hypothetical protein
MEESSSPAQRVIDEERPAAALGVKAVARFWPAAAFGASVALIFERGWLM